jgi:DNA-binding SARP family transcriptional activator
VIDFGILGTLEVRRDDRALALGGVRERSLLALLLLNANELVPTDRLVEEFWGEDLPKTAVKTVQVYVSRLRKVLGAETIVTRSPGYLLRVDPERIDAQRFERLAGAGREALATGDAAAAARLLGEALSLWRGAPLADFAYESFAQAEAARLEELRLEAVQDRLEADLASGKSVELVAELQALCARHPLRERLRGQLMLALYRSGRQAEALAVYRDARMTLVEELGIDPSRELKELERAVLSQDPALNRRPEPAAPRGPGGFVGRSGELQTLLGALRDARAGRGAVLLIAGEPGIGKSRLADEVAARARDDGMQVLRGRCWEAGGASAYWPWVQILRAYMRSVEPDELRAHTGGGASELAQLLPELHEILGDIPSPVVRDPEALRFRLFDAVATTFRAAARDDPLLIVLDDLHAADASSVLLLRFLARDVEDSRLVLLGAYRDTETGPDHPLAHAVGELLRESRLTRIGLEGLTRADVYDYVRLTGATASPRLIDVLHGRTSGNALFVVEAVRLLAAEAQLESVEVEDAIPSGVRDAVQRRLAPLPDGTRRALSLASVLGREFDPALLESILGADAAEAVDTAIAARLVVAAPGAPGALRFSHALVRDAMYTAISSHRRRELHAQAAMALERRHAADLGPHLAALAHQFHHAADYDRAVTYATEAAQLAAARLAYEEAARLYRLALEDLESAPSADDVQLCDLLLALGDVEARAGNDVAAKRTFLRAADVGRRHKLPDRLGRAALGYGGRFVWTKGRGDPHLLPLLEEAVAKLPAHDSELRARLLARLAAGPLVLEGDPSRPRRFALTAEAVEIARRLGDPAVLAWALDGRKVAIWAPDTLEEQWEIMDELREIAERCGDPEQIVDARICRLIKLIERSELDQYEAEHAAARRTAADLGQPGQRWLVATHEPMYALLTGRLTGLEELIERAYALGRDAVPWYARISRLRQRVVLYTLQGRAHEIEQELRLSAAEEVLYPSVQATLAGLYADIGDEPRCRTAFEALTAGDFAAIPFDDLWVLTMGVLAHACAFLRDTERAAILHERLAPFAHRNQVAPLEASLGSAARPLGELAATLADIDLAAGWFERAAQADERVGAAPWAAHARREHGEMLLAAGDTAAAEALLDRAVTTYRALGMNTWAQRCAIAVA